MLVFTLFGFFIFLSSASETGLMPYADRRGPVAAVSPPCAPSAVNQQKNHTETVIFSTDEQYERERPGTLARFVR